MQRHCRLSILEGVPFFPFFPRQSYAVIFQSVSCLSESCVCVLTFAGCLVTPRPPSLSIHLSISISLSLYLSIYLSISPSLFLCLSLPVFSPLPSLSLSSLSHAQSYLFFSASPRSLSLPPSPSLSLPPSPLLPSSSLRLSLSPSFSTLRVGG